MTCLLGRAYFLKEGLCIQILNRKNIAGCGKWQNIDESDVFNSNFVRKSSKNNAKGYLAMFCILNVDISTYLEKFSDTYYSTTQRGLYLVQGYETGPDGSFGSKNLKKGLNFIFTMQKKNWRND